MSRSRLIALLLAFGTMVVYLPTSQFGFVNFDDTDYVTSNNFVKPGLTIAGIRWAFISFHSANWHPLTWISHMVDCTLFGLNPGAHHCVNILFHAANTALLFNLLLRMTNARPKKENVVPAGQRDLFWSCAFIAALFAWHPLHVESVAWISERKDVLSTFFAMLSLLSYSRFVQTNRHRSFWLALLFFALGLLSKPMLVTLPFVMLLLDRWPFQRVAADASLAAFVPLVREKALFFLLSAVSCIITIFAQHDVMAAFDTVSFNYRLENAPVAVFAYIGKLFWPANLCIFYPMPEKIPAIRIFTALAVLVSISATAWCWRQSRPFFLTGWLWFLSTLVPVIGLVQVGGQAVADRYTYIPSIGFFIALVFLLHEAVERLQTPRIIRFGMAGLILCACILVTENQLPFWRNNETLFRRAADVTQDNDVAAINLGVALNAQGRYEEALSVYRRIEKSGSRRYLLYNNLGNVLRILGRPAESLIEYRKAIQLNPGNAALHRAAANQLATLNRFNEALAEFSMAEQLDPDNAQLRMDVGKVFFKAGRDVNGLNEFSIALRLDPDDFTINATIARYLAANENTSLRDGTNALILALKANELSNHSQPMVLDILGMAFAETGNFTNAIICSQNALAMANATQMKNIAPLQMRLELYKNHQPWRESFRADSSGIKE